MPTVYGPKFTHEQRCRAVASILAGASLNGTANYLGMSRKYVKDLRKSPKMLAEIERLGEKAFIEEYAIHEDVEAIKANAARYT